MDCRHAFIPAPGAGVPGGAYVSGVPVGSILWVKRVSSSVRLRFWSDVAGQTLLCRSWRRVLGGRVLGWFEAGARRESRPGGNRLVQCWGWYGGRLLRAVWVGGPSCCGSLAVGEVSFGGVSPGSGIRCDEGGHFGRFRLGRSGLVRSRRDEGRCDGPFVDGRRDDGNLRLWLEGAGIPHVLAIKRSEKLWAWTDKGPRQVTADRLAS